MHVAGKERSAAEVLAGLPSAQRAEFAAALSAYGPWVLERNYRFTLPPGGGLLLAHAGKLSSRAKETKLTAAALAKVEGWFPLAEVPAPVHGGEDALGNAFGEFGDRGQSPRQDDASVLAPVVFLLAGDDDQDLLMGALVADYPYLAGWASGGAGARAGFLLERPPLAGLLTLGKGLEEYDPLGELVHRAGRLALQLRYGRQPDWLRLGMAWDLEFLLRKRVDCFPARSGFVGTLEHAGWEKSLRAYLRSDEAPGSLIEALCAVTTKRFEPRGAWLAQGTFAYLREHHVGLLGELAAAFQRDRSEGELVFHGDGTWTSNPAYATGHAAQRAILEGVLGSDFESELRQALSGSSRRRGSKK